VINVSVITESLSFDCLKFALSISSDDLYVKHIIVAPRSLLHPKRKQQIDIKRLVFGANLYREKGKLINIILTILESIKIKCVVVYFAFRILALLKGFKVCDFAAGWPNRPHSCLNNVTIIHSFEGILAEDVIRLFPKGIINIHPAIIPDYRGLDASLWALLEDAQLGVSAYLVDSGIDTGSVIKTYSYPKAKVVNVEQYLKALKELKRKSYSDAIKRYVSGDIENPNPTISRDQNRGVMSKEVLSELVASYRNMEL